MPDRGDVSRKLSWDTASQDALGLVVADSTAHYWACAGPGRGKMWDVTATFRSGTHSGAEAPAAPPCVVTVVFLDVQEKELDRASAVTRPGHGPFAAIRNVRLIAKGPDGPQARRVERLVATLEPCLISPDAEPLDVPINLSSDASTPEDTELLGARGTCHITATGKLRATARLRLKIGPNSSTSLGLGAVDISGQSVLAEPAWIWTNTAEAVQETNMFVEVDQPPHGAEPEDDEEDLWNFDGEFTYGIEREMVTTELLPDPDCPGTYVGAHEFAVDGVPDRIVLTPMWAALEEA